jgi:hypothetical protein
MADIWPEKDLLVGDDAASVILCARLFKRLLKRVERTEGFLLAADVETSPVSLAGFIYRP